MLKHLLSFSITKFASAILQAFGALWLAVEAASYFFSGQTWVNGISEYWWLFLLIGVIIGVIKARPKLSIHSRISGTDVDVAIRVASLFDSNGAIIAGCNTTFDISVSDGVISEKSVQGQYLMKYFRNEKELKDLVASALNGFSPIGTRTRDDKPYGNREEYEIGTTVALTHGPRNAFFVAISRLNKHRTAESNDQEYLDALPRMWSAIRSRGGLDNLDCPIIGSGFARLKLNREELLMELIKSFVVATRDGKLTEKITFFVSWNDFNRGRVDLNNLQKFLDYQCSVAARPFATSSAPIGTEAQ